MPYSKGNPTNSVTSHLRKGSYIPSRVKVNDLKKVK